MMMLLLVMVVFFLKQGLAQSHLVEDHLAANRIRATLLILLLQLLLVLLLRLVHQQSHSLVQCAGALACLRSGGSYDHPIIHGRRHIFSTPATHRAY